MVGLDFNDNSLRFKMGSNEYWLKRNKLARELHSHFVKKGNFLEDVQQSSQYWNYIDPLIIKEWDDLLKSDISPYEYEALSRDVKLTQSEWERKQEKNRVLIESTEHILSVSGAYNNSFFGRLVLYDKENIILKCFKNEYVHKKRYTDGKYDEDGCIQNELTMGNSAHSMCVKYRRPFQLIGTEHFAVSLANLPLLSTSVPIYDSDNELVGCLATLYMIDNIHSARAYDLFASVDLYFLLSLASAIQSYMQISHSIGTAFFKNFDISNEPLLCIDDAGVIKNVNSASRQILNSFFPNFLNRSIVELFSGNPNLADYVGSKCREKGSAIFSTKVNNLNISIYPLLDYRGEKTSYSLVRLDKKVAKRKDDINIPTHFCAENTFEDIVAESKPMQEMMFRLKQLALTKENILLIGETGVGKDILAQAIHNLYAPQGPFVVINCAAIPENLIESELFGYAKGSFTGADPSGRLGKIELANGGTLFLDEIGDMPYNLQTVFLRVLEEKTIMRVGGTSRKRVDFRLITATNADLEKKIKFKEFREDLFYRISTFSITVPPLRERGKDIELLFRFFLDKCCCSNGWNVPEISDQAMSCLAEYSWPGNVRQLSNTVLLLAFLSLERGIILPEHVPENIRVNRNKASSTQDFFCHGKKTPVLNLSEVERITIKQALAQANENRTQAARLLGISQATLYRKIKAYDL
ncbi:MAG: sigma 54-interacting transcriptional regulator [Bacillota bacterium]